MKEQIIIPNKIMPKVKEMANKWHISEEAAFVRLMGCNIPRPKKLNSNKSVAGTNYITQGVIHPKIKRIIIVEVA